MSLIAGIVTFNPNINRLKQNVKSIQDQVDEVIIVDNGSNNNCQIGNNFDKLNIISLNTNYGIAYAQNQICKYAERKGYEWVILLDQDSICPENLVLEYLKYQDSPTVGMLCPVINDINCGIQKNISNSKKVENVEICIASASSIRLEAWKKVGGFCEEYFIDSVDFDMCLRLREAGYNILRVNSVILLHEVGHSKIIKFFGKERQLLNHSALRYYYMYRNAFLLGKRHRCKWKFQKTNLLRFIMINLFEDNKIQKDKMIIKGLLHGIIGRYGKY